MTTINTPTEREANQALIDEVKLRCTELSETLKRVKKNGVIITLKISAYNEVYVVYPDDIAMHEGVVTVVYK